MYVKGTQRTYVCYVITGEGAPEAKYLMTGSHLEAADGILLVKCHGPVEKRSDVEIIL